MHADQRGRHSIDDADANCHRPGRLIDLKTDVSRSDDRKRFDAGEGADAAQRFPVCSLELEIL